MAMTLGVGEDDVQLLAGVVSALHGRSGRVVVDDGPVGPLLTEPGLLLLQPPEAAARLASAAEKTLVSA